MMRCVLPLVFMAASVQAQSVKLAADEIEILLSGNTAIGVWDDVPYRQYFGDDGVTIFAQDGTRSARGEWRVDMDADEYQSIWAGDGNWEGWFVMEYAGDWFWVSKTTPPSPFSMLDGEQLVAD
ncbi:hypothetical protein L0664_02250 [Octadecabacter sp. G9-8]|uniref:Uncharacterized protein n=1 Tax=Octadecabacter dasysiphoniae TaxID=2909341 RepID=A0ABS9CTZ8_9RHOB|nr:hypothetical protein [Octadecabacter dasysiphoniae]MCF2869879.1 hypothetical protein [Octadecabacter dasysiphoniae]